MGKRYKILYEGASAEIVEKKSRFIADVAAVETEAEAMAFLESIRKKYWDCKHHCSAFTVGENNEITRCSDDGEPSGTAGRPILDIILGMGIHNVCVVVSRYFGGTLLGTGGLVRAYGQAAKLGLEASTVVEKIPGREVQFFCDYNSIGKIQYIAGNMGLNAVSSEYTDSVMLSYMVPVEEVDTVAAKITEATGGRTKIEIMDEVYYAMIEKELFVF